MLLALGIAVGLAATSYNVPIPISVVTAESLTRSRRADRRLAELCEPVSRNPEKIGTFLKQRRFDDSRATRLIDLIWEGDYDCQKDRKLAIELMEARVTGDPLRYARHDDLWTLAYYHGEMKSDQSRARSIELSRILWVRGDYHERTNANAAWTDENKRDFIARDDVWAFISEPEHPQNRDARRLLLPALCDPKSPRYDPARAIREIESQPNALGSDLNYAAQLLLKGQAVPKDEPRAVALLERSARYDEDGRALYFPYLAKRVAAGDASAMTTMEQWGESQTVTGKAARGHLLAALTERLGEPNLDVQQQAATELVKYVNLETKEAEAPLFKWIDTGLRSKDLTVRAKAWPVLHLLLRNGNAVGNALLEADVARQGGVVVQTLQDAVWLNRDFITDDDYPPSAIRAEEEGMVSVEVIISPDGRVFSGRVLNAASPRLGAEVIRLAQRRIRRITFPKYPGRYVRVMLPPVQFRLGECGDKRQTPAVSDAILINAKCFQTLNSDTVIAVSITR